MIRSDTNKKHKQLLHGRAMFIPGVRIWLPSPYSQRGKDCEFSSDAWSPL